MGQQSFHHPRTQNQEPTKQQEPQTHNTTLVPSIPRYILENSPVYLIKPSCIKFMFTFMSLSMFAELSAMICQFYYVAVSYFLGLNRMQ